jgi:hypothetical protein
VRQSCFPVYNSTGAEKRPSLAVSSENRFGAHFFPHHRPANHVLDSLRDGEIS